MKMKPLADVDDDVGSDEDKDDDDDDDDEEGGIEGRPPIGCCSCCWR